MSVSNDDKNKVFGVVFRTPLKYSTGIPHIVEHCVLCGSRKYPLKEPFVELLKGSLHTFINPFTYPDWTCYPVASTNTKVFLEFDINQICDLHDCREESPDKIYTINLMNQQTSLFPAITKILGTLGPKSRSVDVISGCLKAGMTGIMSGVIFPSLLQLERGITDVEDRKSKQIYAFKYRQRDEMDKGKLTGIEIERDEEYGICMEINTKVVLPNCNHSLCMKCYRN